MGSMGYNSTGWYGNRLVGSIGIKGVTLLVVLLIAAWMLWA